jgi:Arc/MetJ family transcription regulator
MKMVISSLHYFVMLLERESQRTIDVDEDDTDDDVVAAAVKKGQLLLKRKILRIMLYRMRNPLGTYYY